MCKCYATEVYRTMPDPVATTKFGAFPDFREFFAELDRNYVPHLSVNCVVFAYREGRLYVLLYHVLPIKAWGHPGAYVRRNESLDHAANASLLRTTGIENAYLSQFHTFGGIDRVEATSAPLFRALGVEPPPGHWGVGRVISVGYFAMVDMTEARLVTATALEEYVWRELTQLPQLGLDHDVMLEVALTTLRMQLDSLPLDRTLLKDPFTMPELQRLYEAVHGRVFDRRNFQKQMLDLGLVERLEGQRKNGPHPPAYLYRWIGKKLEWSPQLRTDN